MAITLDGTNGVTLPDANSSISSDSGDPLLLKVGGTEMARVNTSGNLGLGVTPSAWYSTTKTLQIGNGLSLWSTANTNAALSQNLYLDATATYRWITANPATNFSQSNGVFTWQLAAGTPTADGAIGSFNTYMTLDASGNLLVGTTSPLNSSALRAANNGIAIHPIGQYIASCTSSFCAVFNVNSTNTSQILFQNNGVSVGSITSTGSATTYATSSDYRLKENIQPMTGALATVAQLNPVTYSWKADGSAGQGFIAHELQAVVPDCVTGEKDAVDAEGNPVYQGVDTSFLVATLTAAIKEQQALIQTLTARIEALEQA